MQFLAAINSVSIYKCKAKFGYIDVSDARKLKALEKESAKLRKLQAEVMLDNVIFERCCGEKW